MGSLLVGSLLLVDLRLLLVLVLVRNVGLASIGLGGSISVLGLNTDFPQLIPFVELLVRGIRISALKRVESFVFLEHIDLILHLL